MAACSGAVVDYQCEASSNIFPPCTLSPYPHRLCSCSKPSPVVRRKVATRAMLRSFCSDNSDCLTEDDQAALEARLYHSEPDQTFPCTFYSDGEGQCEPQPVRRCETATRPMLGEMGYTSAHPAGLAIQNRRTIGSQSSRPAQLSSRRDSCTESSRQLSQCEQNRSEPSNHLTTKTYSSAAGGRTSPTQQQRCRSALAEATELCEEYLLRITRGY